MHVLATLGPRARSDPSQSRSSSEALRGPVLVSAVLPPLAAGSFWQQRQARASSASCFELEPQAAVPLLVFMEDRHAPSSLSGSYGLVHRRMEKLHIHLNSYIRRLQDVHDSALEQSKPNLGETIDF
jgi:hypothetical protein